MLRIELERRKRNLTQKQLGEIVHIVAPDICRFERCTLKPCPAQAKRLSQYFNMQIEELLKEVD
jgi:ribosome-binding protein aMBF1 (putative translation factor)